MTRYRDIKNTILIILFHFILREPCFCKALTKHSTTRSIWWNFHLEMHWMIRTATEHEQCRHIELSSFRLFKVPKKRVIIGPHWCYIACRGNLILSIKSGTSVEVNVSIHATLMHPYAWTLMHIYICMNTDAYAHIHAWSESARKLFMA